MKFPDRNRLQRLASIGAGAAATNVVALEGSSGVRSKGSRRSIVTPARCATRDALSLFIDSNSPQQ
jgi:hypothetical protein